jgi:hypothetical protein
MADTTWTVSMIEERFVEAADVMKRLPDVRVSGYYNTWPKILYEFSDLVGQEPPRLRRPRLRRMPSAEWRKHWSGCAGLTQWMPRSSGCEQTGSDGRQSAIRSGSRGRPPTSTGSMLSAG